MQATIPHALLLSRSRIAMLTLPAYALVRDEGWGRPEEGRLRTESLVERQPCGARLGLARRVCRIKMSVSG